MKAIVLTAAGGPEVLEEQDRPNPVPGPGQIRVRVLASALNRADLLQRRGHYPAPSGSPPDIGGIEFAGEVETLGKGSVLWAVSDRVMGLVGGGAHAEYVVLHEREAIAVPAALGWEEAAAIPEVFLTAYDALFLQLGLRMGERLLVHAAGSGVGTAAIQLAALAGAESIGTSRSEGKLERARTLGMGFGVNAAAGDWPAAVLAHTGGKGVHAVLDLVGGSYLAGNLEVLAPRGRLIVVGLTAGARAEIDLGQVVAKRLSIRGTVLRARPLEEKIALARDFSDRVLPSFVSGRLKPVIDSVFRFAEVREAHERMEGNETFGKVVLTWGDS